MAEDCPSLSNDELKTIANFSDSQLERRLAVELIRSRAEIGKRAKASARKRHKRIAALEKQVSDLKNVIHPHWA